MINIQIFGHKRCRDTQKAERFFKERKISYHMVNLEEKGISKGELKSVANCVKLENLIDKDGKEYKSRNLEHMQYDIEEIILEHPLLLKTPVVRNGTLATVGYVPDIWLKWLSK